ncbi:ATPdependent RNA helicase [Nowakowskiella sp. JEL0407]|nr:ATPdependent RNA helicase [Nowakowskiella sp. JEL0407]
MAPFDLRDIAEEKKREFATGLSDHLTILTAYNQWLVERRKGWQAEKTFCVQNFLSMRGLNMMASIKRQLAELLSDIGFIPPVRVRDMERKGGRYSDGVEEAVRNKSGKDRHDNWELIKAVMISALYPHVVMCDHVEYERGKKPPRLTWRTENGEIVNLHPASVNSRVKQFPFPFLIYLEKVKTKKIYIRDSTTVSPYALAFFGGELSYNRDTGRIKIGKGWLQFKAKHKTATIIQSARLAFDELLAAKIENPLLDISDRLLVDVVVQLVTTTSSG